MEVEKQLTVFEQQLQSLLEKEKYSRMNDENLESAKLLVSIVQLCIDHSQLTAMCEQLITLSKKRGQPKKAQIGMVQLSMNHLNSLQKESDKIQLLETLKQVCEKKIFLEVEYARCCLMSVKLMENEDNINEAAKIMQEVQVETYGSMDKREKLEFILYQMRIMIKKKDFVRLFIISKKISQKAIDEFKDLSITYNSYLVIYYMHEQMFLEASDAYRTIVDTQRDNNEIEQTMKQQLEFGFINDQQIVFENYVSLLLISKHSEEKKKRITELTEKYSKELEIWSHLGKLVKGFTGKRIISVDIKSYDLEAVEIFRDTYFNNFIHRDCLFKQLIQHNLILIELYYNQIHLTRIQELLNAPIEICEQQLCLLINQGIIYGRIDRVDNVVSFEKKKNENERLKEWQGDLDQVLGLLDMTCNLIQRENETIKVK